MGGHAWVASRVQAWIPATLLAAQSLAPSRAVHHDEGTISVREWVQQPTENELLVAVA